VCREFYHSRPDRPRICSLHGHLPGDPLLTRRHRRRGRRAAHDQDHSVPATNRTGRGHLRWRWLDRAGAAGQVPRLQGDDARRANDSKRSTRLSTGSRTTPASSDWGNRSSTRHSGGWHVQPRAQPAELRWDEPLDQRPPAAELRMVRGARFDGFPGSRDTDGYWWKVSGSDSLAVSQYEPS
jgi:hypothetical protein